MERPESQQEEHQKDPPLTSNSSFDWVRRVVLEKISQAESERLNRQSSLDSALELHDALEQHHEVVEQLRAHIAEATS